MTRVPRQALGARGPHVILVQRRQHRAARVPHQDRGDGVAQHERRHDGGRQRLPRILGQRHVARGRQPAEMHRNQQDQHDPQPEIRHRQAGQPDRVGDIIPDPLRLTAATTPAGTPISTAMTNAMTASCAVTGSFCAINCDDRLPRAPGIAQVALHHVADPVQVLHRQRAIQPKLLPDLRQNPRIAPFLPGQHQRRIARHQLLQAEHQDTDQDQGRNDLRQAGCQGESVPPAIATPTGPAGGSARRAPAGNRSAFADRPTMLTG